MPRRVGITPLLRLPPQSCSFDGSARARPSLEPSHDVRLQSRSLRGDSTIIRSTVVPLALETTSARSTPRRPRSFLPRPRRRPLPPDAASDYGHGLDGSLRARRATAAHHSPRPPHPRRRLPVLVFADVACLRPSLRHSADASPGTPRADACAHETMQTTFPPNVAALFSSSFRCQRWVPSPPTPTRRASTTWALRRGFSGRLGGLPTASTITCRGLGCARAGRRSRLAGGTCLRTSLPLQLPLCVLVRCSSAHLRVSLPGTRPGCFDIIVQLLVGSGLCQHCLCRGCGFSANSPSRRSGTGR